MNCSIVRTVERSIARVSSFFKRINGNYKYDPLDEDKNEIRLLTLFRGRFSERIRISLRTEQLTATGSYIPKYEALSYVWGSPEGPRNIFARTTRYELERTIAVTRNLEIALSHLRLEDEDRVMWIDAICINQADLVERSKQVKRMADVYQLASRVVIWLGEAGDESNVALGALEEINSKANLHLADFTIRAISPAASQRHWADRNKEPPLKEEEWSAVGKLLARSYFERLWIWQEARLANDDSIVVCGPMQIPWSAFRNSMMIIYLKPGPGDFRIAEFADGFQRAAHLCDNTPCSFDTLAEMTQRSKCHDPRDRIYALLAIVPPEGRISVEPDYTKNMSDVYQEFCVLNIRTFNDLGLLRLCEYHRHGELHHEMPSWVPNLSIPNSVIQVFDHTMAAGHTVAETAFIGSKMLLATGVVVSTINIVHCASLPSDLSFKDVIFAIRALGNVFQLGDQSAEAGTFWNRIFRLLVADSFADTFHPSQESYPRSEDIIESIQWLLDCSKNDVELPPLVKLYLNKVVMAVTGRSVFLTKDGNFGLAPQCAQKDDVLAVLLGCGSPMVLRPCANGQFQIIGEGYLQGYKNGEALMGKLPFNVAVVWRLCSGVHFWSFIDRDTDKFFDEDPRLGPLSPGWECQFQENEGEWPVFWNDELGVEPTKDDPRLTSEALRKRGVPLRTFELI